jgi:prolyl-tRNA synthetase
MELKFSGTTETSEREKFADADLIGIPVRLVVSEKTGDKVEWKKRSEETSELIPTEDVIERLKK